MTMKPAPRPKNLKANLAQFTGTENWYQYPIKYKGNPLLFTDGIAHLTEEFECGWLLDVVFSNIPTVYNNKEIPAAKKRLLVCRLLVDDKKNSARFTIHDGDYDESDPDYPYLTAQDIEFTDFPALEQIIWVICDYPDNFSAGTSIVALLPSEN